MTKLPSEFIPIHALLERGRCCGHRVCHDGQNDVVWSEFAGHVAAHVDRLKRRPESRWLLVCDDTSAFAVMLLALLYAGKHVVIPHNAQPGTLSALSGFYDARIEDDGAVASPETPASLPSIDPSLAIIDLYTSGSTGQPKRIRKSLLQLETEVEVLESVWGDSLGSAAFVATVPQQHIYGLLFRLLWPLSAGRAFDSVTCAHPDTLVERLAVLGTSALISSPAQLGRMHSLLDLASLQPKPVAIFSSGGPLTATAAGEFYRQLGLAPTEVFGSTETGGVAWRRQEGRKDSDLWTPFPGIDVRRSDSGALLLRSPYLGGCEPLEMDDGIEMMPDGRFRLLGRLDRVVKIEEKRVSLPDMEFHLETHPWVAASALVSLARRRQSIGAVVVLTEDGRKELAAEGRRAISRILRKHLSLNFEAVLLPRHWRLVDALPVDDRGKVSRAALSGLFAEEGSETLFPEVLQVNHSADERDRVILDLHVIPAVSHFEGHFPGLPILPGVVQIDWVVHFARKYLPVSGVFSAMENVKFLSLILRIPGSSFR